VVEVQAGVQTCSGGPVAGKSGTSLARELGLRTKFWYAWKAEGKGSAGMPVSAEPHVAQDPQEREIARQIAKLADVQGLNGQQAAELDFFAAALRSIKAARPNGPATTGKGPTK
jgi:hypothetical protein